MARYIDADKLKAYLLLDQSGMKDTVRRNNSLHPDRKLEFMAYIGAIEYCVTRINEELTADVVEVKHGEWKDRYNNKYDNHLYECSVCGREALYKIYANELCQTKTRQALTPACPYCTAKMDGGADNGNTVEK